MPSNDLHFRLGQPSRRVKHVVGQIELADVMEMAGELQFQNIGIGKSEFGRNGAGNQTHMAGVIVKLWIGALLFVP